MTTHPSPGVGGGGVPYNYAVVRVEIHHDGYYFWKQRHVDRTFPDVFLAGDDNLMTEEGTWQDFCNQVDAKLMVVHHLTRVATALILVTATAVSICFRNPLLFLQIFILGLMMLAWTTACVQSCVTAHGLHEVCARFTKRSQGRLRFEFRGNLHRRSRPEMLYIEIYILQPVLSRTTTDYLEEKKKNYHVTTPLSPPPYQPPLAVEVGGQT